MPCAQRSARARRAGLRGRSTSTSSSPNASPLLEIVLRPEAEQDIRDIADYTEARWYASRAKRYIDTIGGRIRSLAEYPGLGSPADSLPVPCRELTSDTHRIFSRVEAERSSIVRILHVRMDVRDLD
jgi:plasmid stabilization system protein ParE